MRFILALIIGVAIGAAAVWYSREHRGPNPRLDQATDKIQTTVKSASDSLQDKLHSLNLNSDSIKEELAKTGRVIREKTQQAGQAIADATADGRTTAAIKAKLVRDPNLSAWDISVNTTGEVVTLSGTVSSPDDIGKAMVLALDTDGVRQVISTLQVKPK